MALTRGAAHQWRYDMRVGSSPVFALFFHLPGEEPISVRLDEDDPEVHADAVWKKSYVDNLPDTAFLYIEPGGTQDADGKTEPRSKRHFPYRNDTGDIDLVHVRDAIGRILQSSLPAAVKAKAQAKAEKLLGDHKKMDEAAEVSRNDVLRLDSSKMRRTPQGGLRGPAAVSRVGVFLYKHTQGPMAGQIVREYRPADEVFQSESLATLDQAPITDGHPKEGNGLLTAANVTKFSKGQITDIHVDHNQSHVLSDAVIQEAGLVKDVMSGARRDFSPGYTCKMDWTPGVWNGQAYDVVQRNIRYNHVAILPPNRGRQGPSVALRFDAAMIVESPMLIHLDGKDYDLADEAQRAAYHAALTAKTAAEKTRADKAEARADALEAEVTPLRAEKVASARTALETQARTRLGAEAKFDGLTDRQVREKTIGVDCTGKSDEYVAARFDQLLETAPAPAAPDAALDAARAALLPATGASPQSTNVSPAWTERWKRPLTASKDK